MGPLDPDLSRDQDPTTPHEPRAQHVPDEPLEYLSSPEDPTSQPAMPGQLRRIIAELRALNRFPIVELS